MTRIGGNVFDVAADNRAEISGVIQAAVEFLTMATAFING